MKVILNVAGVMIDRRTKAQLAQARALEQQRLDQAIERVWRERVAANVQRRLDRKVQNFIGGSPK